MHPARLTLAMLLATACGTTALTVDGGPLGDGGAGRCDGLAEGACLATAGCAADFCQACSCDRSFKSCRAASAAPAQCPALGCPQPLCCTDAQACTANGGFCRATGEAFANCGACNPVPGDFCTLDADCNPRVTGTVCEPVPCACQGDARLCAPGCANDTDCLEGTTCDAATRRCQPRSCSTDAACPPRFGCSNGQCARSSCTTDAQCGGFCVKGKCYRGQGTCELPRP